jgi:hypothetical protein
MSTPAKATFQVKGWDEKTWDGKVARDIKGAKTTRASVKVMYKGDIEGEGQREYLMIYRDDETGNAIGLEQIVGKVGGRSGSFVIQSDGTFVGHSTKGTWFIVPGSGTGELKGLTGNGEMNLDGQKEDWPVTFEYRFE